MYLPTPPSWPEVRFFSFNLCFKERILVNGLGVFKGQRKADHRIKQLRNFLREPKVGKKKKKTKKKETKNPRSQSTG